MDSSRHRLGVKTGLESGTPALRADILQVLVDEPSATMRHIGQKVHRSPSTVKLHLAYMEAEGTVKVAPCSECGAHRYVVVNNPYKES